MDGGRDLVDRLYDVALDPSSYEDMLDAWDAHFLSAGADPANRVHRLDHHLRRASVFLDRLDPSPDRSAQDAMRRHEPLAAILLDRAFQVVANDLSAGVAPPPGLPASSLKARLAELGLQDLVTEQDVRGLAATVFASGDDIIQTIGDTSGAVQGITLAKVFPVEKRSGGVETVAVVFSRILWNDAVEAALRDVFQLSRTETEIVRLALELKGRTEIAQIRGRSVETVKRQFNSIFSKTGCHSSTELLVLVFSLINMSAEGAAPSLARAPDLIRLPAIHPKGRDTGYVWEGAADGRICVHLPGPYCLSEWPVAAARMARRSGLRIITPVRAGYGPRLNEPVASDAAEAVTGELLTLFDTLEIENAPLVTQSNDIVFAIRFAAQHPDRVSAIVACAGALPLTRRAQYQRMDKWHRFILGNARYAPRTLPFLVKAGFYLAQKIGKERFLEAVYADAPGDLEVAKDPVHLPVLLSGSRFALDPEISAHHAFATGIASFARTDWAENVTQLTGCVPIHLVNGPDDPMTRPETLEELRIDYPGVEIHPRKSGGEFVIFQHWPKVIELIEAHL